MSDYKTVTVCDYCGCVYPGAIPLVCKKCGEVISTQDFFQMHIGTCTLVHATKKVMKRTLFGWKEKPGRREIPEHDL